MRYLGLFFVLLQGMLCSSTSPKSSFRLLILHDGETAKNMTNPHATDCRYIRKTFRSITAALKLPMKVTESSTQEFSSRKFREWTQKIQTTHDIAIVYYSGRQNKDGKGLVPSIQLSRGTSLEVTNGFDMSAIPLRRRPRFALTCFDCYETLIPFSGKQAQLAKPLSKKEGMKYRKYFQKLFLKSHGNLLLGSPQKGHQGFGFVIGEKKQGAFTRAFLAALRQSNNNWCQLIQETRRALQQNPFPEQDCFETSSKLMPSYSQK